MSMTSLPVTRRDFFSLGGLTLSAIAPLGLSLSEVLAREAQGRSKKQINVIFLFLQGGASHIDMYDLKPNAPDAVRGKYSPAATLVQRFGTVGVEQSQAQVEKRYGNSLGQARHAMIHNKHPKQEMTR